MEGAPIANFYYSHKRAINATAIVLVILAVIIGGASILYKNLHNASVFIFVSPSTASVKINGQEYKNGVYDFFAGNYTAEISAEGFTAKQISFNLENNKITNLFTYLSPTNNDFSIYESKDNQESLSILQQLSGYPTLNSTTTELTDNITTDHDSSANSFLTSFNDKLSIRNILPLYKELSVSKTSQDTQTIKFITINDGTKYDYDCQKAFCLVVSDSTEVNHKKAEDLIKENGYNPDDFEIIYTTDIINQPARNV